MILLYNEEVELARDLMLTAPAGIDIIEGSGGYAVSAYPSVVVDVPAYSEDRPSLGPNGEFLGMERVEVPAHEEVLRLPANWEAVESYVDYVEARAAPG